MTIHIKTVITLFVCCTLGTLGCGKGGPQLPKCYPVSGKVLVNGKPAARAIVGFHPQAAQPDGKKYGGSTFTNDDGSFRMTTFTAGDGVPAGDYVITIESTWIQKDGQDVGVPDQLKGEYAQPEKSTLKVTVTNKAVTLDPYDLTPKS